MHQQEHKSRRRGDTERTRIQQDVAGKTDEGGNRRWVQKGHTEII